MDNSFRQTLGCIQLLGMVALLVLAAALGGTFRTEVKLPPSAAAVSAERSFTETLTVRHWLGGLVQGDPLDLRELAAKHSRQGDRMTQVSIVTKHTATDLLVTLLTLGIYTPETVTIEGKLGRPEAVAAQ